MAQQWASAAAMAPAIFFRATIHGGCIVMRHAPLKFSAAGSVHFMRAAAFAYARVSLPYTTIMSRILPARCGIALVTGYVFISSRRSCVPEQTLPTIFRVLRFLPVRFSSVRKFKHEVFVPRKFLDRKLVVLEPLPLRSHARCAC